MEYITYAHQADPKGARFQQLKHSPIPEWACDIQDYVPEEVRNISLVLPNADVFTVGEYVNLRLYNFRHHRLQYGKNIGNTGLTFENLTNTESLHIEKMLMLHDIKFNKVIS